MSIAGIAKEVTTIIISSWFFGDELTPLNITGVAITVCGKFRGPSNVYKYSKLHFQGSFYSRTTSTASRLTRHFRWMLTEIL